MKTLSKVIPAIALIIALLSSQTSALAEAQMVDLGTLGGNQSVASDINNNNQIVGSSENESEDWHAFLLENGTMTDLTPGYPSQALAINQDGQIVGYSEATGYQHATLWDHGTEIDLGTLGGYGSIARDINDQGQVVGESVTEDGEWHAFLWSDGNMIDLGTLGGIYSYARSINNRGEIVGISAHAQGKSRPFLWKNGIMTDLGTLGGEFGSAESINSSGRIVGGSANELGQSQPTLWFQAQTYSLNFGYETISPSQISNSGKIVGYYNTYGIRAFLWSDGSFVDLGTLGGDRSVALGVNDDGYVVGESLTEADYAHAFLWIP